MDYVKTGLQVLFFIPFMTFLLLFAGTSFILKVVAQNDMKGRDVAEPILGFVALLSIGLVRLLGKVYE